MQPLVSVIIPLYNAEKYIAETIVNLLQQTYKNIEILIINDGSTDNSLSRALNYESDRVKIFSQINKGASSARNYGLKAAKGEFIQFLDADDLLSENKIEEQVKLLISNPNKVAVCSTIHFFDGELIKKKEIEHDWFYANFDNPIDFLIWLYGGYSNNAGMIQPNSWLTPKHIIDKAGFWNEQLTVDDDGEFFCRVLLASKGTVYSPNAINYYRKFKKGNNLSSKKSKKAYESIFLSTSLKAEQLLSKNNSSNARKAFAQQYLEIAVMAFPEFLQLSRLAELKSRQLGNCKKKYYVHTPFYKITSFLFGWKFSAFISFIKLKLKS